MILLDTNALIWVDQRHARVRGLQRSRRRLFVSPASLLELQFLAEVQRIRLTSGGIAGLVEDGRWTVDEPPSLAWMQRACDLGWTRDPFDRLIVAHAQVRGWALATADRKLLAHVPPPQRIEI